RHSHNASLTAKKRIVHGVAGSDYPLLENPMRSANFAVLRSGSVPSVLIETGFLSNPTDEKSLSSPTRRAQIARLLAEQVSAVAT
ncbi:N-acetylmuramoyl-L-alanine amidase, partial [Shewanella algae]|uniref:N-acetylmuramoyl-L-alanine amidase family protein n=1 Tax=Shewanella algae TaxID=38313 RepID=UPI00313EBE18